MMNHTEAEDYIYKSRYGRDWDSYNLSRHQLLKEVEEVLDSFKKIPSTFRNKRIELWRCISVIVENGYSGGEGEVSHRPRNWNTMVSLCGCDTLRYTPFYTIHFTLVTCSKRAVIYCIHIETLTLSKHRLGECPHGKYKAISK